MTEFGLKQKILSEIYSKGFTEFYHGNYQNRIKKDLNIIKPAKLYFFILNCN